MTDAMQPSKGRSPTARTLAIDALVLAGFAVLAGGINVWLGKDYSWDLRNYHFYNAWAFLNDRIDVDVLAANLQGYNNPLIELPFYGLVKAGLPDFVIGGAMALPTAIAAYVVWVLTGLLEARSGLALTTANRLFCVAAAVTGGAGWCQWGTTSGEWPVTTLCFLAFFLTLRDHLATRPTRAFWLVGPLIGCACGLKLTAIPFGSSVGLAMIGSLVLRRRPGMMRQVTFAVIGAAVTFVAVEACWGSVLFRHFHNPLFPYFNGVFRSEFIEKSNWRDDRYLSHDLVSFLRAPFDLAFHYEARRGETAVRDPRALLSVLICVAFLVRFRRKAGQLARPQIIALAGVVFLVGFSFWLAAFSFYRYTIGFEITAAVLLFLFVAEASEATTGRWRWAWLLVYVPLLSTSVDSLGRWHFTGGAYFEEKVPALPRDTVLINLIPADPPLGYLSPMFGEGVVVVKPYSNLSRPGFNESFQRQISAILKQPHAAFYAVMTPPVGPGDVAWLRGEGFEITPGQTCGTIWAPPFELKDHVCQIQRLAPAE